jgi:hypothetical protein
LELRPVVTGLPPLHHSLEPRRRHHRLPRRALHGSSELPLWSMTRNIGYAGIELHAPRNPGTGLCFRLLGRQAQANHRTMEA